MTIETYNLVVIGTDVADVVTAAAGWIVDRVRAGWRVSILLPAESEIIALKILGVTISETDFPSIRALSRAAVAVSTSIYDSEERVRRYVRKTLSLGNIEVSFRGDALALDFESAVGDVQHRLSNVARAFKAQALSAVKLDVHPGTCEEFRSAATWYPPNCSDLTPVS